MLKARGVEEAAGAAPSFGSQNFLLGKFFPVPPQLSAVPDFQVAVAGEWSISNRSAAVAAIVGACDRLPGGALGVGAVAA